MSIQQQDNVSTQQQQIQQLATDMVMERDTQIENLRFENKALLTANTMLLQREAIHVARLAALEAELYNARSLVSLAKAAVRQLTGRT